MSGLWRVHVRLAAPALRARDRQIYVARYLSELPEVVSSEVAVVGGAGRYCVDATLVVHAADRRSAGRFGVRLLESACAAARLPSGAVASLGVEPAEAGPSR